MEKKSAIHSFINSGVICTVETRWFFLERFAIIFIEHQDNCNHVLKTTD